MTVGPKATALLAMLCLLPLILPGCRRGGDEERVKAVIEAARTAAVDRDTAGVLEQIDDDYRDPDGRTKREIRALLLYQFLRNRSLTISVIAPKVVVSGDLAAVRARVVLTGSEGGGLFPDSASGRDFDLRFARRGPDWRLVSASWSEPGDDREP
jgi:hypothetical protein